jgi:hypothetical protein
MAEETTIAAIEQAAAEATQRVDDIATGKESVEDRAGWSEMPERPKDEPPKTFGSDQSGIRAAAHELQERRVHEAFKSDPVERQYARPETESIRMERGASDLSEARATETAATVEAENAEIARQIDEVRQAFNDLRWRPPDKPKTGAPTSDLVAPEVQQALEGADAPAEQLAPQPEEPAPDPNEPRYVRQMREDPQFKAEVEQMAQEAATIKQSAQQAHEQTLRDGLTMQQASLLMDFPGLAGMSAAELGGAMAYMAQKEPEQYQKFQHRLQVLNQTVQNIQHHQQRAAQQQQAQQQQQWQAWSKAQDDAFDRAVANEPKQVVREIQSRLPELLQKHYNISKDELFQAYHSNPLLRSTAAQKMLWDLAKYHMAKETARRAPVDAPRGMMRPGTSQSRLSTEQIDDSVAARAFRDNPDPRSGARLLQARRAAAARNR